MISEKHLISEWAVLEFRIVSCAADCVTVFNRSFLNGLRILDTVIYLHVINFDMLARY
jgi:hypothetical protein